jgi:integrase
VADRAVDIRTRALADCFLAATRTDLERGTWIDPTAGKVALADYAEKWLADRPSLRPRTVELLRLHVLPDLGSTELAQLTPGKVRSWRARLIEAGHPGRSSIAKSYRLLHAICATALEDGFITRNPCVTKGASAERPVAMIEEVLALADAIEPRHRAMVLLATFCGLRVGELRALRQRNLDLLHRTVAVVEQYQQLGDGALVLGPPKTDARTRVVAIPASSSRLSAAVGIFGAARRGGVVLRSVCTVDEAVAPAMSAGGEWRCPPSFSEGDGRIASGQS